MSVQPPLLGGDPDFLWCIASIAPNIYEQGVGPDTIILGQTFLRQWFTVYNMDPLTQIGLTVEIGPAAAAGSNLTSA